MSDSERTMLADGATRAVKALVDALSATKSASHEGIVIDSDVPDHPVRITAAEKLLDRRYGRPTQTIAGDDENPLRVDMGMVQMLRKLAAP